MLKKGTGCLKKAISSSFFLIYLSFLDLGGTKILNIFFSLPSPPCYAPDRMTVHEGSKCSGVQYGKD